MEPIGRIDSARMEDHINSNIEPSVPLSVYQELYQVIMVMVVMMEEEDDDCDQQPPDLCIFQELGGHRGLSNSSGSRGGRRTFQNIDLQNMELDRAPLQVNLLSVL